MSYRKRVPQVIGASVVTGAIVFSSAGVANASEATEPSTDSVRASSGEISLIPGDHVETLAQKYGVDAKSDVETKKSSEDAAETPNDADEEVVGAEAQPASTAPTTAPKNEGRTQAAATTQTTPATVECKDNSNAASKIQYFVNGTAVASLQGNVEPGDNVRVGVTASDNCEGTVSFGLAGYQAPSDSFSEVTASEQILVTKSTVALEAGQTGWINVNAPECYFQVDLFVGEVLDTLGPEGSDNFYEGRLLAAATGGTSACEETPEVPSTPTTPVTPTEVLSSGSDEAPVVLAADSASSNADQAPEAQVASLAATGPGTDSMSLIALGSALTLLGAAMERASRRMRRVA